MKAYQRVLNSIGSFFRNLFDSEGGWIVLAIVFFVVVGVIDTTTQNTNAETEQISWCLDNGGRMVTIDDLTDCFQLTEVSEVYGPLNEEICTADPSNVYIPSPGTGNLTCYEFKRLVR